MEYSENFHTRCDIEEAIQLSEYLTIEENQVAVDCFVDVFENTKGDDTKYKIQCALGAVYMLGFISGARAIRERQKVKRQA